MCADRSISRGSEHERDALVFRFPGGELFLALAAIVLWPAPRRYARRRHPSRRGSTAASSAPGQIVTTTPAGTARWVWEIFRNGTYSFHAEGPGAAPPHSGTFAASKGHYILELHDYDVARLGKPTNSRTTLRWSPRANWAPEPGTGRSHRRPAAGDCNRSRLRSANSATVLAPSSAWHEPYHPHSPSRRLLHRRGSGRVQGKLRRQRSRSRPIFTAPPRRHRRPTWTNISAPTGGSSMSAATGTIIPTPPR